MDSFFRGLFKLKSKALEDANVSREIMNVPEEQEDEGRNGNIRTASGFASAEAARRASLEARTTFAKPGTYSGNRNYFDDGKAKKNAKLNAFQGGQMVIDPYTGDNLVLTKKEAKLLYGNDWSKHLAESDHIKPLKRIYEDTKNNVWNTTDDLKRAGNSSDNIRVTSSNYNNAKRIRTNAEYVNDDQYLEKKGVRLTEEGKRTAILDGKVAEQSIQRQLTESAVKNIITTGHNAGMAGAQNAGITAITMSSITNCVDVIQGKKDASEAVTEVIQVSGKAAATGYVMSGGLTVASQSLSNVNSPFIQGLAKSNIPGKVITAVLVTGDTLKRYANGEISTQLDSEKL